MRNVGLRSKHSREVDGRDIGKRLAIVFCVLACGVAWLAIIGLVMLFWDSLPV